ncbi:2-hydroxyacyl-CoA dehydratase family protein [Amycolatopsis acidiphila]|uniref:2-hydroxyacyl-CoA dehydratase n=1 Tax=Amycolatopsis acidiphila TaxID=715473 RepID=A0A558AM39_9PSEU|nr:2-hydroxyacyl-CoA dehydratase family protein [Amycolatopsis acidiphila]TVT25323.1 2-hydroxyacyl-CoA dehydratase [Amycolatopsis acidiphila]UIJ62448.1 2-hydroxyacyl-CoA dehydratase family protein [Amycolatopsis acidiphila]GHG83747.1 2-hydroxyglutaryl-CoA dehydratase [Amycolatopsis acidiphila]
MTDASSAAMAKLVEVARDPRVYIEQWRSGHAGRPVLAILPMNFPRELAHAAGALPVIVQDDQQPITEGRALLAEFYCGYTRNLADQVATGRFDVYDGVFQADHCIQLIGSADIVRSLKPDTTVFLGMLNTSMNDPWAPRQVSAMMRRIRAEIEAFTGNPVELGTLRDSIGAYNRDRALIRRLLDERATGNAAFGPVELQDIITSSMVMDPVEHHALLTDVLLEPRRSERDDRVRVHLSGHLCHAPRRELLEVIEDSGAAVVDDDLYHGRRYVSTDVAETGDPVEALGEWYARRNVTIPCPTRVQQDVDWDGYLVDAVRVSAAEAVIHLVPKFCEPHMLYYPELRKRLDAAGIPQLQIETEHEGIPLESFRTRIETLVERARRRRPVHV